MKTAIKSFRLDPKKLKKIKSRKINLAKALDKLIDDLLDLNKCPTCGQAIKNEN